MNFQILKTVYFATPDFAIPTLEMLLTHPQIELVGVVTMPDRPAGRGQELQSPPVAQFCKEKKIPLFQTDNVNKDEKIQSFLKQQSIDLFIVLAFAQFLKEDILNIPKIGCFNIHTSILPKYRGAAPIQYAILNGDDSTGVSIQKMVKKMDAGDLVHFDSVPLLANETGESLFTTLKFQAALSTKEFILKILSKKLSYTAQDEKFVTFAPTIKKEDGLIRFHLQTAIEIERRIRAFYPWPGTYCFLDNKRLKIISAQVSEKNVPCNEWKNAGTKFLIGCKHGTIEILKLQEEGKKICSAQEFLNRVQGQNWQFKLNPQ